MSRKEKRFQAREVEILSVTRSLVTEYGLAALTMERIAKAIDYSKAVIYQHFPCKEEIIPDSRIKGKKKTSLVGIWLLPQGINAAERKKQFHTHEVK